MNEMENPKKIENTEARVFNEEQTEKIKERTKELIEEVIAVKPQMIVFMDRGARPLAWMLRAAWSKYASKHEMPKIRFVNIGREKGEYINFRSMPYREDYNSEEKYLKEVRDFWFKFDTKESKKYIDKLKKDIKPIIQRSKFDEEGGIMLVDDYSVSGFSLELANLFFANHFPNMPRASYLFLKRQDESVFKKKEGWSGTHLPWNTDKSYTLLSEEENPDKFIALPERDAFIKEKGLALKQEIKKIFNKT